MFRVMYTGLTTEQFGFWALLWSFFGFGAVFDFGFSMAVQKQVAQQSVKQDWEHLSRVLTSVFVLLLLVGLLLMTCVWLFSDIIIQWFQMQPENREGFRRILVFFSMAMGLSLPLSVFNETLRGLQRISLINNIGMCGATINFLLVLLAFRMEGSFTVIFLIPLVGVLGQSVVAGVFALRFLPKVHLEPRWFTPSLLKETGRFSGYAYLIMVSYTILTRTDQFVLASLLAVSAVQVYQPGAKLSSLFWSFARQFANTLQPAAAHLHATEDHQGVKWLIVQGTRYSLLIATPLYLFFAFFLEQALLVVTDEIVEVTYIVGQLLLLWTYTHIATQNIYKRIAVMCGQEKRLMIISVTEAILNLGLSVVLVLAFQEIYMVAVGTLAASMICGWGVIWHWAARDVGLGSLEYAKKTLLRNWLAALPLLAVLTAGKALPWFDDPHHWLPFLLLAGCACVVCGISFWLIALHQHERKRLLEIVRSRFRGSAKRFALGSNLLKTQRSDDQ